MDSENDSGEQCDCRVEHFRVSRSGVGVAKRHSKSAFQNFAPEAGVHVQPQNPSEISLFNSGVGSGLFDVTTHGPIADASVCLEGHRWARNDPRLESAGLIEPVSEQNRYAEVRDL